MAVVSQPCMRHDLGLFVHDDHLCPELRHTVRHGHHNVELAAVQIDAHKGHPAQAAQVNGAVLQSQHIIGIISGVLVADDAVGHGQLIQRQRTGHLDLGPQLGALCAVDGGALGCAGIISPDPAGIALALHVDGAVLLGQDDVAADGNVLQRQHGVCRIPGVAVVFQRFVAVSRSRQIQLSQRMGALGEGHGGDHQEHDQNTGNEFLHFSPSLSFLCIYFTIL